MIQAVRLFVVAAQVVSFLLAAVVLNPQNNLLALPPMTANQAVKFAPKKLERPNPVRKESATGGVANLLAGRLGDRRVPAVLVEDEPIKEEIKGANKEANAKEANAKEANAKEANTKEANAKEANAKNVSIAEDDIARVAKRILSEEAYDDTSDPGLTYSYTHYETVKKRPKHRFGLPNQYEYQFRADRHHQHPPPPANVNDPAKNYRPKYPASPYFGMCSLSDFGYSKDDKLGRGGFGKVYYAVHRPTGIPVAIKKVSAQSIRRNAKHVENEETIHHALLHPYITRHYCTMKNDDGDVFFAMEYIPGKNMAKSLHDMYPIEPARLKRMIAEMVVALEYLHKHCIVYRDLKAENVLISPDDHIKFIDFGLSVYDCQNLMTNLAGTLEYTAPEMAAHKKYGRAVDWYSLGILVYTLIMAKLPMTRRQVGEREAFLSLIAEGLDFQKTGDANADDLIAHLTSRSPRERWGLKTGTGMLIRNHPFFRGVNWEEVEGKGTCTVQYPPIASIESSFDESLPTEANHV